MRRERLGHRVQAGLIFSNGWRTNNIHVFVEADSLSECACQLYEQYRGGDVVGIVLFTFDGQYVKYVYKVI